MQKVKLGHKVKINYVMKTDQNTVVTSSQKKGPLILSVGHYQKVKGLNTAILGMEVGDKKVVVIKPEEGFGTYDQELITSCSLTRLPADTLVGHVILDGQEKKWVVKEINENEGLAYLDGNHLLAGKNLIFEIELVQIMN